MRLASARQILGGFLGTFSIVFSANAMSPFEIMGQKLGSGFSGKEILAGGTTSNIQCLVKVERLQNSFGYAISINQGNNSIYALAEIDKIKEGVLRVVPYLSLNHLYLHESMATDHLARQKQLVIDNSGGGKLSITIIEEDPVTKVKRALSCRQQ